MLALISCSDPAQQAAIENLLSPYNVTPVFRAD